ncbi:MAG: tetratricopeptide repeat protein, partial [Candidatus Hydrogenedentota bacterium]
MKNILFIITFLSFSLITNRIFANRAGTGPTDKLEENASVSYLSSGKTGRYDEIGTMFISPAALSSAIRGRTWSFGFQSAPADFASNFFFLGYAWPTEKHTFFMGIALLNTSGLEKYNAAGEFESEFSTNEVLVGFSHATQILPNLRIGETLKIFYLGYNVAQATIVSADAHLFWNPFSFFQLSFSLTNLFSTPYNLANTQEFLPVHLKLTPGIVLLKNKMILYYTFDSLLPLYADVADPIEHRVGVETFIWKNYLRVSFGYDGENFTSGIASTISQYNLHFGYLPTSVEDRFGLSLTFNLDAIGGGPFGRPKHLPRTDLEEELLTFYKGLEAYNSGKYKEAYDDFDKVLQENPDHKLAKEYRERALLHLRTSKWLDDEQRRLIKLHKDLAKEYEEKENYGEAISEWRMVLKLDPTDSEAQPNIDRIKKLVDKKVKALHAKGLKFYAANDKLNAINAFSEALKLNPEYEPSKKWLVKIKQELTLAERAERERIERLQKAEVYYNRGLSYYGNKSFEEAIQQFELALKFNPDHENAKRYLKLAKEELEAERKGLRGKEASYVLYQKGLKNYRDGQYFRAMQDFRNAIRAYEKNQKAKNMLKKARKKLNAQTAPLLAA